MVYSQLLTECADLGTGQRRHATTVRAGTDRSSTVIPNHEFIHKWGAHGFAAVKKGVYDAMTDQSLRGVADKATDSDAFEYAARAGFAVSGVLHLLLAFQVRLPVGDDEILS